MLYVAAPVEHEGELYGVVQLSIPTQAMWAQIRQTWLSLLVTALVVLIITVVVSLWLAKGILEPILLRPIEAVLTPEEKELGTVIDMS